MSTDRVFTLGQLKDLVTRLEHADRTLREMAEETDSWGTVRLLGKAEGCRLALSYVEDILRGAHGHTEAPTTICGSRGPRIGTEGTPICKRPQGHVGAHRPDPSDGWGRDLFWKGY